MPNRGYRLESASTRLLKEEILTQLGAHPWAERVQVAQTVDSTNTRAKLLAAAGAPEGTVLIADEQTGGRGRMGRSFVSPPGAGVYLSVILRPQDAPHQLLHLTAVAAEAACRALEAATGLRPGIKWTNDLLAGGRKVAGILTELSIEAESGSTEYVVVGIGVNCNQEAADFPPELREIAGSLRQALGHPVNRNAVAAELIRWLARGAETLQREKTAWINAYAADCVTLGRDVRILSGGKAREAHADGLDENAGLWVTYPDGSRGVVSAGEVSVRNADGK